MGVTMSLPKWPALLLKGTSVTPKQASNIIMRTSTLDYFSTNSKEFEKALTKVCGKHCNTTHPHEEIYEKIGSIANDLNYLLNKQICSCWIGGLHGWCSWDGKIETSNYNIGKYPSIEEVFKEFSLIAKTFPYLEFEAQLLSGETCETDTHVVVTFKVKNGVCKEINKPTKILKVADINYSSLWIQDETYSREIGCTIEHFEKALKEAINLNKGEMK